MLYKNIYISKPVAGDVHWNYALFFDKCQFLFLWTIILMYYMYIFALKLSESNVINILYICKFF